MKRISRRSAMRAALALSAGGVAAAAVPARAAEPRKTPFDVAPTFIPIAGNEFFPVRRIYCIGRNYAAHAR